MNVPRADIPRTAPRDLQRKQFQQIAAVTLDRQAQAIQEARECLADLSARLDRLTESVVRLECGVAQRKRPSVWEGIRCWVDRAMRRQA